MADSAANMIALLLPSGEVHLGAALPLVSVLPFVALLLAIALLPLFAGHYWESNRNKAIVVAALSLPFAFYIAAKFGDHGHLELRHAALDYLSFMALLGSLFVISGGVHLRGSLAGTPLANTGLLAIGALLANLIGTTGASMVLIRPLLRANEERKDKTHLVIFFIFIVSNCAGLLTPLGDPPLFLGFLKGVPFAWTLALWKEWIVVNGLLLVIFNVVDQRRLAREEASTPQSLLGELIEHKPLRVDGWQNLFFLVGVIGVIVAKGRNLGTAPDPWPFVVQEGLMLFLALAAWFTTRPAVRHANRFAFGPIVEVAVLFAGIFITMIAPLQILNGRGDEFRLVHPWQYFWATGFLSSFLDNAPTYLAFAAGAAGQFGVSIDGPRYLAELLARGAEASAILAAISCGAVFMGANTYIGNGPNFMVKSIAEANGVKMPSFLGYMAWSCGILLPIFAAVTFLFFR
jgi:Na+/H+ antiporter NhaD/arsenite permease-like protein